jgi:hypothetical protein
MSAFHNTNSFRWRRLNCRTSITTLSLSLTPRKYGVPEGKTKNEEMHEKRAMLENDHVVSSSCNGTYIPYPSFVSNSPWYRPCTLFLPRHCLRPVEMRLSSLVRSWLIFVQNTTNTTNPNAILVQRRTINQSNQSFSLELPI